MEGKKAKKRAMRVNRALRRWFESRGLPLEEIWTPIGECLDLENRQLENLQRWVLMYEKFEDRRALEERGYRYPPIEPDFDPDTDWLRFERWMAGEHLNWRYDKEFGELSKSEGLTEEQLRHEIDEISDNLASRSVIVSFRDGVPLPLVHAYLRQVVEDEEFEIEAPHAFTVLDGCSGYCPACFQRPWCDAGNEPNWPEDEDAERLVYPKEVRPYLQ